MSSPVTTDEMRAWLSGELGREVTVSKVKYADSEVFLADYVNHAAPASKLVSDTEDGAIAALYSYLKTRQMPSEIDSEG